LIIKEKDYLFGLEVFYLVQGLLKFGTLDTLLPWVEGAVARYRQFFDPSLPKISSAIKLIHHKLLITETYYFIITN
jgi:hypothetical protein